MAKAPVADHRNVSDVPLARLHLDPENPRHDPIQDEDKIIAQLFATEKVLALVKDIAAKGAINPLDQLGVVEMADNPGHYIVVEGNRRVCAMKVLGDPLKAPTQFRKAITSLTLKSPLPSKFSVIAFKDKQAAEPWLRVRHLGDQGGAGIRPWDPAAKNRFARGATPDQLAVAVLDRAVGAGWIDKPGRRTISVTTLTRYLSNPVVRAALGLGSPRQLTFTHDPGEVDAALENFVTDALPRKGSSAKLSSRSTVAERVAYAHSLHKSGVAPRTALSVPIDPPPPTRRGRKTVKNPRHPDKRMYIVTSAFVVANRDKNLLRILTELRSIKPEDGLFAVNYLVRAAIERVMVLYAIRHKFHKSGLPDHMLVKACHEHLEKNGVSDKQTKTMRVAASNKDAAFSLDTLGSAVHGAHVPTKAGLIAVWDNWEPCLQLMLERI